jgi:hypothetical protein
MDSSVADADTPDLRIRMAGQQALGSRQSVFGHFKVPAVYVDGYDPAMIAGLHLGTHLLFIHGNAEAGMLFLAVSGMGV